METPQEIIDELKFNDKFLTDEYKRSKYYREYLHKVFVTLEELYQ